METVNTCCFILYILKIQKFTLKLFEKIPSILENTVRMVKITLTSTYIVFFSSSLQHPLKHQNVVYNNSVRLGAKPDGKIDSSQ